jgi:hypothetical protein
MFLQEAPQEPRRPFYMRGKAISRRDREDVVSEVQHA